MKNITKKITRISTVLTASILSAALPLTALAAQNSPDDNTYQPKDVQTVDYKKSLTPEFAYSAEKWATLRDNIMEYGELTDLIHEYNPTVLSNRSTYKDQKNKNLNDIYDDYMKDIDDIWDQADNADNDVTWASLRYSAGLLTKQADNNYEDAEMEKIQYDQQEAKLVYQAQEMMVSLEQSAYNLENLQSTRDLLQQQYEATQAQMSVGMATQTDVLTALKSVQDQDTAILTAKKSQENVHRNLCLMLGWSADAQPEIREVPQPDLSRVDALDPNADAQTAIDNNYDVRYYTKKAGNLTSQDLIESNQAAIVNAKDTAIRSLKTQYNTVLTTRDSLNAAKAQLQVAEANLNLAQANLAVGSQTKLQYQSTLNTYTSAKNDVNTKELQLLLALEAYDWNVKGLTTSN